MTDPNDAVASRLNRLPKHVATRTLSSVDWAGSEIVRDPLAELDALKARYRGELQVHGSANLLQTLIREDLVDEFQVFTFPVVVGPGKRLFGDGTIPAAFELAGSETSTTGVVISTYRRAGDVRTGTIGA